MINKKCEGSCFASLSHSGFGPIWLLFLVIFGVLFNMPVFSSESMSEINTSDVTLVAAGDLMMSRYIGKVIKENGIDYPLGRISKYISGYDLAFCNLESIIGSVGNKQAFPDKPYNFLAATETVRIINKAGFDVVCLANNHAMDYGYSAATETFKLLKDNSIGYFGIGPNLSEARKPCIKEIKGIKAAFLGYGIAHSSAYYAGYNIPGIAPVRLKEIARDIAALKGKVDYIVVSLHWGNEYVHYPSKAQRRIGHKIIDAGADIILGHHPHVLQGIENYKNKVIVYSLGNLLFDQKKHDTKYGALVAFTLSKAEGIKYQIIPLQRFETYFPGIASGSYAEEIYGMMEKYSSVFNIIDGSSTRKN